MRNFLFILSGSFLCWLTEAHPGVGILEDSKGNVYYTDLKHVWKIPPRGDKVIAVHNVHTHELYLDKQDNLYGEHLWYNGEEQNTWGHYVWRLSPVGEVTKVIPDTKGFLENYSFVRDHFGRMYWVDRSSKCQHVVRKNADNSVTNVSNDCFENIRKVESMEDGTVYLIDFQDLKRIDTQGRVTTVASRIADKKQVKSTAENQNSIMGIWDDVQGNLYAAVSSERLVKKFGPDGKEEIVFRTSFPWAPTGGMVDARGTLWVLEYSVTNAARVEKIGSHSTKTSY